MITHNSPPVTELGVRETNSPIVALRKFCHSFFSLFSTTNLFLTLSDNQDKFWWTAPSNHKAETLLVY
eukprot:g35650.t1